MKRTLLLALVFSASLLAKEKEEGGAKGGIDKKTAKAIDEAVAKGIPWLRAEAGKELAVPYAGGVAHMGRSGKSQTTAFPIGRPVLLGLALLESGVSPSDPLLQKIWEKLRAKPSATTYEAGVGLMFAEAYLRASNGGKRVTRLDTRDR